MGITCRKPPLFRGLSPAQQSWEGPSSGNRPFPEGRCRQHHTAPSPRRRPALPKLPPAPPPDRQPAHLLRLLPVFSTEFTREGAGRVLASSLSRNQTTSQPSTSKEWQHSPPGGEGGFSQEIATLVLPAGTSCGHSCPHFTGEEPEAPGGHRPYRSRTGLGARAEHHSAQSASLLGQCQPPGSDTNGQGTRWLWGPLQGCFCLPWPFGSTQTRRASLSREAGDVAGCTSSPRVSRALPGWPLHWPRPTGTGGGLYLDAVR